MKLTTEVVGVVRVPLVPGVVGDGAALDVEVDSSLQNRVLCSVAVDSDPCGRSVLLRKSVSSYFLHDHRVRTGQIQCRKQRTSVLVLPPEGVDGVGTTKVPVTDL